MTTEQDIETSRAGPDTAAVPGCSDGTHYWNIEEGPTHLSEMPDADSDVLSCLKCGLEIERRRNGEIVQWGIEEGSE